MSEGLKHPCIDYFAASGPNTSPMLPNLEMLVIRLRFEVVDIDLDPAAVPVAALAGNLRRDSGRSMVIPRLRSVLVEIALNDPNPVDVVRKIAATKSLQKTLDSHLPTSLLRSYFEHTLDDRVPYFSICLHSLRAV